MPNNTQTSNEVLQQKYKNEEAKLLTISKQEIEEFLQDETQLPTWITSTGILYSSFWVHTKENLETLISGNTNIKIEYKSCETIAHGQNKTFWSEESIDKFALYTCSDREIQKTCNNGNWEWDEAYSFTSCTKWEINNCIGSGSYVYNNHTYSIPSINHWSWASNILSSNVSENQGTFQYTLTSIECNDGEYVNPVEHPTPILQSCDENYHTEDSVSCISNTRTSQACIWKPANSIYNTATSITQTWSGTLWTPSITAVWNTTASTTECRFTCNTWFTHQSGACNDITAPTGWSFTINWWATTTNSTNVTLNITCPTDIAGSNPIQVAYWNTSNPTNWTNCTSSISHTLTSWDESKTIYVRFRDNEENTTNDLSRNITLNTYYKSCLELKNAWNNTNGKYTIAPTWVAIDVYCDMTTNGGWWTLIWWTNTSWWNNWQWQEYLAFTNFSNYQQNGKLSDEHIASILSTNSWQKWIWVPTDAVRSKTSAYWKITSFTWNSWAVFNDFRMYDSPTWANSPSHCWHNNSYWFRSSSWSSASCSETTVTQWQCSWWYGSTNRVTYCWSVSSWFAWWWCSDCLPGAEARPTYILIR